jgi:hypothetical protein
MNGFALEALHPEHGKPTRPRTGRLDDFMAEQFEKERRVQSRAKAGAASAKTAKTAPLNDQ